jgi:prepilin-type N-terminal cleavage/methylation domain-containing protein
MRRSSVSIRDRSREGGFTVIELMITIALLAVIVGATLSVLESTMRTSSFSQQRVQTVDQLRLALDSMTKEIRQARAVNPGSNTSRLNFTVYVNGHPTDVAYYVEGSLLYREVQPAGSGRREIVAQLKTDKIFCYDYAAYPQAGGLDCLAPNDSAPGDSRLTRIIITFPLGLKNPETDIVLSSGVQLRNLGG